MAESSMDELDGALAKCVEALCSAVDGVDWNAGRVQAAITELHRVGPEASAAARDAAVARIAERVARSRVEDADGVAHAAISGGSLVEWGGAPRALGEALLAKLPDVLLAARRYADACIAARPADETVSSEEVITTVDHIPVSRSVFRSLLVSDRPGAAALARLEQWVLPAVATWTRDRPLLAKAIASGELRERVQRMRSSRAHWLDVLLATQLEATWRVVLMESARAFELCVDGVSRNFELHASVEEALAVHGAPVTWYRREPGGGHRAALELFTHRATTTIERSGAAAVSLDDMVWREGAPTDVPVFRGVRTLVATLPTIERSWNASRPFAALVPSVRVVRELARDEARELIAAMREGS